MGNKFSSFKQTENHMWATTSEEEILIVDEESSLGETKVRSTRPMGWITRSPQGVGSRKWFSALKRQFKVGERRRRLGRMLRKAGHKMETKLWAIGFFLTMMATFTLIGYVLREMKHMQADYY